MGVFDFVKNAGAKIGIGTSTDEEAAAAAAEAEAQAEEEAIKRGLEKQAAMAAKAQDDVKKAKMEASMKAQLDANAKAKRRADARERMAEYTKANELEKYVRDMGIAMDDIEIRFDDGTAYISGEAADQGTKERIILAVGNAQGVGKVDEEIDVAEPSDPAEFHTVQPGDTLWAVAEKVYGDGSKYTLIFEENKPMLKDPDLIFPGQVLRCPK